MAKRINKPEQLPEWFNLERYEVLLSLSVAEYQRQLLDRLHFSSDNDQGLSCGLYLEMARAYSNEVMPHTPESHNLRGFGSVFEAMRARAYLERIQIVPVVTDESGTPRLSTLNDDLMRLVNVTFPFTFEETTYPDDTLTRGNLAADSIGCLQVITNLDLAMYDRTARSMGAYGERLAESQAKTFEHDGLTLNADLAYKSVTRVYGDDVLPVSISLEHHTDAEILAELAALLPKWRKALGVNEPERAGKPNAGLSLLLKAVEYRVIPLLDLMLWQRMEGVNITRALLAAVLFPAELEAKPRDHNHMAQTIMPFVSSLFKNDTWKMIGLALEEDPTIKRRSVGEMVEIERAHQSKKYRRGGKL